MIHIVSCYFHTDITRGVKVLLDVQLFLIELFFLNFQYEMTSQKQSKFVLICRCVSRPSLPVKQMVT